MSVYRVIDKLESTVRQGLWMPFGWRAVNSDRLLDLVEKLRSTLPDDMSRPKKFADAAERAVEQTKDTAAPAAQADEAKPKAIGEADIVQAARAKAGAIIADAQAAARNIHRGADEYADQVLASLDTSLAKALAAVQKGRQTLATSAAAPSNGKKPREMSTL